MAHVTDFSGARRNMVGQQLIRRGIRDPEVLRAMGTVKRHYFVPEHLRAEAYDDYPLPIDRRQTISQPYIVALMSEALGLSEDDTVLEIGTGSGYQAAVLAEICRRVYSVETYPELAAKAEDVLRRLGYDTVEIRVADGTAGWPDAGPFDGIIVTAGAPHVPSPLLEQLAEGGRLVIPVGDRGGQELLRLTRRNGAVAEERLGGCRFVPLRGEYGWK